MLLEGGMCETSSCAIDTADPKQAVALLERAAVKRDVPTERIVQARLAWKGCRAQLFSACQQLTLGSTCMQAYKVLEKAKLPVRVTW